MQMRDIDKLTFMEPAVREAQKKRSLCVCCKKSKGKGQTFCLSTRKYRRCHRICKACRTRKSITPRSLVQVKKKCKKIDEDMERMRARFQALSEKSGESRRAASEVEEEIRILQAREERRGSCASQSNGRCFDPAIVEYFSRWAQHRLCSSSLLFMEKSAEYMAVNIGQSQPLRSEEQEQKRRELGNKTGMMRGRPMGGMRVPLLALLWILLKAQMLSVGAWVEEIPARQEMEHALLTVPDHREGTEIKRTIKWVMRVPVR